MAAVPTITSTTSTPYEFTFSDTELVAELERHLLSSSSAQDTQNNTSNNILGAGKLPVARQLDILDLEFETAYRKLESDVDRAAEADQWLNPSSPLNRAIFASYLSVGFGLYFLSTPLTFYLVDDLNATASQQAMINGLMSLPWALKIVCGFLSDAFPIAGLRRKPYFLLGWGTYIACNLVLAAVGTPGVATLALLVFLMTMGFVQVDGLSHPYLGPYLIPT
jgi:hypothetical protein